MKAALSATLLLIAVSCAPAHVRDHRARQDIEEAHLTALEAASVNDIEALRGLERLARDATIRRVAARAAYRAGDRHREAGRGDVAKRWWRVATRLDPEGGWARAGVERLHDSWETETAGQRERLLRTLRHPALDGMLLYLAAAGHATDPVGRGRAIELCLLQRVRAPRSAYRDDCEDLVLSLLDRSDRIKFAESLFIPLPSDDPTAFDSPRFQGIELNLARDLAAAGRLDEAARRYRRVVDRYPSVRLKDDALWFLAGLYREQGERQLERSALKTLVENLPHSRFHDRAAARLSELD
jgi:tetratricopeptide (TPR) repeat protein